VIFKRNRGCCAALGICLLGFSIALSHAGNPTDEFHRSSLWAHGNLVAWLVGPPWDSKARGPEERAQMLQRLGFKSYAYCGLGAMGALSELGSTDAPAFDAEIQAMQRHGIHLVAWQEPLVFVDADNPVEKNTLEAFKRRNIHPQLWRVRLGGSNWPTNPNDWGPLLPKGMVLPKTPKDYEKLSEAEKADLNKAFVQLLRDDLPKTAEQQERRVKEEADRVKALVKLAAPYGIKVELYSHGGWYGMEENQLAIIERLKKMGVTDVGMVYNFSHSRDELHDDSKHFPELWGKIKDHVVAINITGIRWEGQLVYPSEGDSELEMMRTIQESGWRGPIGVIAEKGGDAEVTLRNDLIGLDWLAAELKRPGSGGPRPFPTVR
jgi:hypothetical protein